MRARVAGIVLLESVVGTDGRVSDVRIARSLDPVFGLDQEAMKAAKRWQFDPATRFGEPVPVVITIERLPLERQRFSVQVNRPQRAGQSSPHSFVRSIPQ